MGNILWCTKRVGTVVIERAILTVLVLLLALLTMKAHAQSSGSTSAGPIISKLTEGSAWLFAPSHYSQAAAYGSDGTIYFTEFAKRRLMKLSPKGLEPILTEQPGLYGVAVDSRNRIYVGLDLSDDKDKNGKYLGSVNRVEFDSSGKAFLKPLVTNIRRPRNLVVHGKRIYFILEAERVIVSINPDQVTESGMPNLRQEFKLPIKDSANGLAIYKGRFYWAQYGEYADPKQIVGGSIRSTSMKKPGEIITIASGLGRTRGVGFDASGNLYFTTEANEKDQGNSGVLGKISPDGELKTLIDRLDYPQFLAVFPNGSVIIPFCRENFIAMFYQNVRNKQLPSPYPGIKLFGVSDEGTKVSENQTTLTLTFNELGKSFNFSLPTNKAVGPRGGWVTIPFRSLGVSKEALAQFTDELPYPVQPEIPAPGFFKKPIITCSVGGKPCAASVLSRRTRVKWRWPMTGPAGAEKPPPGFKENPDAFLVNFYW